MKTTNKIGLTGIVAGAILALGGCVREGKVVNKEYRPGFDYACQGMIMMQVGDVSVPMFFDETCHQDSQYLLTLRDVENEFKAYDVSASTFSKYKLGDNFSERVW